MKASAASRAQADNNIWEQQSDYFPTLSLTAQDGRLRLNDKTTRALTASRGAASSWMGEGRVTLVQPLFNGFSTWNRVHSAKELYSAANYDLAGTAEDVAMRAVRAHLNLMRTKEMLGLANQFLSDIQARRQNIAMMVKGGAADEAELLQADEMQTIVKNARFGYEESFRQAEADYIEVAGAPPAEALALGEPNWNAFIPPALEDSVASAVKGNPRILAANRVAASLLRMTNAEKASLAPQLNAEMSYMKQDQLDIVGGETSNAQAMLKLAWNFSTGGGQFARIQKTQQQQVESAAKRQGVMRIIERDVRQKYSSMLIVDQQYDLLAGRESSSKKILDNFTAQFEGGKQSNLQLIAAHSKLFDARAALTDARYRQMLSRFELLNAMGALREAFGVAKIGLSQKG